MYQFNERCGDVMTEHIPSFFMGAIAGGGYRSYLKDIYNADKAWHAYLIKGGAGMGKSTLMKGVAKALSEQGIEYIAIPCPSDPNSLDGVVFPSLKVSIMDATAPHIVNPVYPEVCEVTVNLGQYCRREELMGHKEKIIACTKENKVMYDRAYRYTSAAAALLADSFRVAAEHTDMAAAARYGTRVAENNMPKKNCGGNEKIAFLSGVTGGGHCFLTETIDDLCQKVYVFADEYGAASRAFMSAVRITALNRGYNIITCMCPFAPDEKPEHILVPELSLAFTTQNRYLPQNRPVRRINARRFTDISALAACRQRLSFNRRGVAELIDGACRAVKQAKEIHDIIEGYYIVSMDFDGVEREKQRIIAEILANLQN